MSQRKLGVGVLAMICLVPHLSLAQVAGQQSSTTDRTSLLRGSYGTYDGEPRTKDGHVDVERLVSELVELKANTYHWLIWHRETDWEDLQRFLPLAREKNILVWVCLVPPSESPPHAKQYSEPFRVDYQRWAVEIAKLSLREPNLVAWSVDDFTHNLGFFTPEHLGKIHAAAHEINPNLAFVPCSYSPRVTPQFAEKYRGLIDGILFPYRAELTGANLTDPTLVDAEVAELKTILGPSVLLIVDVYASAHSGLGTSSPEYVEGVMRRAIRYGDGVHICRYHSAEDGSQKDQVSNLLSHDSTADPSIPRTRW